MYALIRRLRVQPSAFDEVVRRDEDGLVPLLRSAPGFVEFDLVQVGEDMGVSVTIFETQEQAEEANRRAAEWIKENVAPLAAGPAETMGVGEVRIREGKAGQ